MKVEEIIERWNALLPISETDKARLSRRFTVEFNYNSNHIEGNTLTYGQTELLLIFGKVVGETRFEDFEEMKASNVGLRMIESAVLSQTVPLSQNFIRQLHKTILREDYKVYRTLPDGSAVSYTIHVGQYKTRPNSVITRSGERFEYASPEETPSLMTDLVDWYNQEELKGQMSPIELAALFHYRYIRIHPFEDGNGRIARLLVNYILARHNYPMIVVRSRNKQEYLDALSACDKIVGPSPFDGARASLISIRYFLHYFTKLVCREIENDIKFITLHGENIWWYDGEMVKFRSASTPKILKSMMLDPYITTKRLSEIAQINMSATNKQLKLLCNKHFIERRADSGWYVIIMPSEG